MPSFVASWTINKTYDMNMSLWGKTLGLQIERMLLIWNLISLLSINCLLLWSCYTAILNILGCQASFYSFFDFCFCLLWYPLLVSFCRRGRLSIQTNPQFHLWFQLKHKICRCLRFNFQRLSRTHQSDRLSFFFVYVLKFKVKTCNPKDFVLWRENDIMILEIIEQNNKNNFIDFMLV